jgi:excisionase family DNA binding protein
MTTGTGEWVPIKQVAELLAISDDSVHRAIRRGDLKAFVYGRNKRVSRDSLDAFIRKHSTA